MDFFVGAAFGQYMLAADPFNGLTHHGGGAHVDQNVAELPDGRIAGDAGSGVGAAAFNAHQEFGNVKQFFLLHGSLGSHIPGSTHCFLNRFQGAAFVLDAEGDHRFGSHSLNFFAELVVGDRFAAQTDNDHAVHIGIAGEAG